MPPSSPVPTKYVELISNQVLSGPLYPVGPGYPVLFDIAINTAGWKEICFWVHVFVEIYETTPVTSATRLELRFIHNFCGSNSFNYEVVGMPYNHVTSYINGYAVEPVIGKKLRVLCHPENLPPGPYTLCVTYMLAR